MASAICLGVIGIWCMHFIGNRAIVLGDGSDNIQLVYNAGWSTLSVFLPIGGLMFAFALAERPSRSRRSHWISLILTGVLSGFSVVGMHYVGNLGISNYQLHYLPGYLAGSILIAVGDCLAVMMLFYTWREKWISRWWKRAICALLLAGGVSAMHFTASTKCVYHFKHYSKPSAVRSRNIQVIVAGILCGTAAVTFLCYLLFNRHRARILKNTSQKVMLACAMFDPNGRLLVTTEGVLPAREITDKYNHRTFSEEFDTAHPVFQWIFRVTRNWSAVADFIPKMKSHISALRPDGEEDSRPSSSASSTRYEPDTYNDYSIIFRERFCVAAASLASSMNLQVGRVGVLYDNIIETGTIKPENGVLKRGTLSTLEDIEKAASHDVYGTGQLLFLTRELNAEATDKLLNSGFKFATVQQIGRNIADTMQIPLPAFEGHVAGLRRYVNNLSNLEKTGAWLSCFAMVPKVNSNRGMDVIVKKTEQDQLPDTQFLTHNPVEWQMTFLRGMHKMAFSTCMTFLATLDASRTGQEQQFAYLMIGALVRLAEQVPEGWLEKAFFFGEPLEAHFSQPLSNRAPITTLYSFVCCTDLHTSLEGKTGITQIPLSFFRVRQYCYNGSPNHVVLARAIHQDFAPLLARKIAKPETKSKKMSLRFLTPGNKKKNKSHSRRLSKIRGSSEDQLDTSSDSYELVNAPQHLRQPSQAIHDVTPMEIRENPWGGILVNSETVVKSDCKSESSADSPNHGFGMRTTVSTEVSALEPEKTFVDSLVTFFGVVTAKTGNELGGRY